MKTRPRLLLLCIVLLHAIMIDPTLGQAAEAAEEVAAWGWLETVGRFFNLFILFGVIFYFTREPLGKFFASRRENIQAEIAEARRIREEAEGKLEQIKAKLQHLEEERTQIRREMLREAELERQRLLEEAQRESERIVKLAKRQIDGLRLSAQKELREYASDLTVRLAEERIRREMDAASERRTIHHFLSRLSSMKERV